ncbi:MAG: aminotransferase class I/II-fold pyridoxal phosphate-dependent enzyme, partial [Candidatus Omnitrophota bacterium]
MKPIPYGKQHIGKDDIKDVIGVLRSDWMTQGPKVGEFEEALARYCGAKYAVVVSSGTAALHIASLAAGLRKGNEVITTPITFLATPNSVLYAGAKPVFADIDYETVNLNPKSVEKKMNKKTKAIMPVHFAGLPCG